MKLLAIAILLTIHALGFAQDETNIEDLIKKGWEKIYARDYMEAIKFFNSAAFTDPEYVKAYTGRAYARSKAFRFDEAQKDLIKAMSLDANFPEAYYVRGWMQVFQGKFETALIDFNTAIDLDPNYNQAKAAKINVYYLIQDYKTALDYADKVIAENPEVGEYYFYKGKVLSAKQKYDKALELYEMTMKMKTSIELSEIYLQRGDAKQNLEQYFSARDDFDKAIELSPNDASAFNGRGLVNYRMGNFEEAMNDFTQTIEIIKNNPDKYKENPEIYFNLAMSLYKMDQIDKACKQFHKSCELGNTNGCKMVVLRCGSN